MQRTLRQPGFWLAFGLVMIVFIAEGVVAVVLQLAGMVLSGGKHSPPVSLTDPLVVGLLNIFAFGVAIVVGLLVNRLSPRRAFPLGTIRVGAWLCVPLVAFGAAIMMSEADNVFRYLCPPPEIIAKLMADVFLAQNRFFSLFFTLVIVAPLTEEFLFRGIILRGFLGRFRPVVAVGLSAMLFAFMHMNPWQMISAFTLGLIFGWFYLRTGSIWLGVAGHALNNSIVVVLSAAPFGLWEVPTVANFRTVEFQPWWLDVVGAAVFVLGVWLFRKNTPELPAVAEELLPPVVPPVIQV